MKKPMKFKLIASVSLLTIAFLSACGQSEKATTTVAEKAPQVNENNIRAHIIFSRRYIVRQRYRQRRLSNCG